MCFVQRNVQVVLFESLHILTVILCVLYRKDCTSNSWYVSWERYSWSVPEGGLSIHGSVKNWGWASEGIPIIHFKGFSLDDWRTHLLRWLFVNWVMFGAGTCTICIVLELRQITLLFKYFEQWEERHKQQSGRCSDDRAIQVWIMVLIFFMKGAVMEVQWTAA